jgi:putative phage-type endonuclease
MTQTEEINIEQGSEEWLELRRTKITSTDAGTILGVNPWKSLKKLREEKFGVRDDYKNAAMQRGHDLEPVARKLYEDLYTVKLKPKVFVRDFAMASVDGICDKNEHLIEIKCPTEKNIGKSLSREIPDYYFAQMQHQLYVLGLDIMYYCVYDGFFGHRKEVQRDEKYIENMVKKEREFYDSLFCVAD